MAKIKSVFRKAILSSSLHGYPRIFDNNSLFQKLMWGCFCLIFGAFSVVLIIAAVKGYLEYHVIVA